MGRWTLAALAMTGAGMPIFYQFQTNEMIPSAVNWGMVDGFLAGVCAIGVAAASRSVSARSVIWSVVAATAASFTFWIKPSGFGLMALTGLAWLILVGFSVGWSLQAFRRDATLRRFVIVSLTFATVLFAVSIRLAFRSEYFSAENISLGQSAIAILKTDMASPITLGSVVFALRTSFGYAVPAITLLGLLAAACHRTGLGSALAASICLGVGIWFWLFATDLSQVRYFLPFGVMAFILVVPPLMTWAQTVSPSIALGGAALAAVPTLIIGIMLYSPQPSDDLQRAMGVNLHNSDYIAEIDQARSFFHDLEPPGENNATIYVNGIAPASRNLQAVWEYRRVTRPMLPQIKILLPVDWKSHSTLRVNDLLRSNFLAVDFIRDPETRRALLERSEVSDFSALNRLVDAWGSGLDESDGVVMISDTRVRILRITNRTLFDAALTHLEETHDLPQAYRDANPHR